MKRISIILLLLLVLFFGLLALFHTSGADPDAPKYVALTNQPAGPFGSVGYSWNVDAPFVDRKVWVWSVLSRTNGHEYLFDLEKRKVVGELLQGGPVFCNRERTKLLCQGRSSMDNSLKGSLISLLSKISSGKIKIPTNRIETYWILDLRNNSAHRVGKLSQSPGSGSSWKPAPNRRFGYNIPSTGEDGAAFFLCDLELGTFRNIRFDGDLQGWWDDRHILIKKSTGDLVLYDVQTRETSTLFSREILSQRLHEFGIPDDPATVTTYSVWNGTNYDFSLVAGQAWMSWYTNGSFMLKLERSGPSLTLAHQKFKFKWLGNFNADQTFYVYPGESGVIGGGGNGGVFVMDILNNTTNMLVPPANSSQYSIPRFYGDSVIYFRNSQLWTINHNGSANTRLFPPLDK